MERITIPTTNLVERDQKYILRIAVQEQALRVEHTSNTIVLHASMLDVMHRIAHRLITCGISFSYSPYFENVE